MTVCLHVWRVPPARVPAALWRMATEPRRLRHAPGVSFAKLLGTARGSRFGPTRADPTRWAALTVATERPGFARWDRIAVAGCRLDLRPLSSRGTWSGRAPFDADRAPAGAPDGGSAGAPAGGPESDPDGWPDDGPVLVLTRARLRATRAASFWRAIGPVAAALPDSPGLLAAFGIGEAPLGWQGTVSVWRSTPDLVRFAYRHPEHRRAIARTATVNWYAEELFARFAIVDVQGDTEVIGWVEGRRLPE
ncbi:MAG: monooxygenase [Actinobacteria bacterium 13_2_20CM_2_71_6]|nr:MAG: monooxygenase [Actinobacteria bacterium 13_2_20CM_2_71_6]